VHEALASGQDVVMRLDVQGAETVRKLVPDALLIFITTENEDEMVHVFRSGRRKHPIRWRSGLRLPARSSSEWKRSTM